MSDKTPMAEIRPHEKMQKHLFGQPDAIESMLLKAHTAYSSEPANSVAAFIALVFIAADWLKDQKPEAETGRYSLPPQITVKVPCWVAIHLAKCWAKYLDAPEGVTLGECFHLEGGGQGRKPKKSSFKLAMRDTDLALAVAQMRLAARNKAVKLSLDEAFGQVAGIYEVSEDIVRNAWKKRHSVIKMMLAAKG